LYLVATPIGNLEDISARALRMLGHVRLIAAEDTRQTRKLLIHFKLRTPVTSYFEHNKIIKLGEILSELAHGDVALVSDAGTPALNDPGLELVRAALEAGHSVSPIPGPSAPLAALVASGLPTDSFLYLGYLPRKSADRRRLISGVARMPYTLIFLEAPHRLLACLEDLQLGLGDRQAAVARELTKLHEEIIRGTLSAARDHFESQEPRGEFTLVIAGYTQEAEPWDEERMHALLRERLSKGDSPSVIAGQVAGQTGWPRREVYRMITEIQKE
jgi:16S rRNA (cytidine1402-2'-O)-methyltransferase